METKALEAKPSTRDVWMRGLFVLLFMIGFWVGQSLLERPCNRAIPVAPVCARAQPIPSPFWQLSIDVALRNRTISRLRE